MNSEAIPRDELERQTEKVRRSWAKQAPQYDKAIGFFEQRVFGLGHRDWACSRAQGDTLEVAVGTALNLAHYPGDVKLTGIDLSAEMLDIARERSTSLSRAITIHVGDAHDLPFKDTTFDTVVCTYSLCNIPDPRRAVAEMKRVLRPGGKLILVDHIRSDVKPIFWFQRAIELFTRRLGAEHMTRRPLEQVKAEGFEIIERDRLGPGEIVERLVAIRPSP